MVQVLPVALDQEADAVQREVVAVESEPLEAGQLGLAQMRHPDAANQVLS